MSNPILPPFSILNWINENRHLLKPPVGNAQIFKGNQDFMVMVVGGPNARKDFHVNRGEEIFYQLEGEIEVGLMIDDPENAENKKEVRVKIGSGEMFLLPANVPHCPRRGPNTVGLVIERYRSENEEDGFQWYCENCGNRLHETKVKVSDIVGQLPQVMAAFYADNDLCICKKCGTKMFPKTLG